MEIGNYTRQVSENTAPGRPRNFVTRDIKYWKETQSDNRGAISHNKHTGNFLYALKNVPIFYNNHELLVRSEECRFLRAGYDFVLQ